VSLWDGRINDKIAKAARWLQEAGVREKYAEDSGPEGRKQRFMRRLSGRFFSSGG
jgi:hypothetical protein